MTITDHDDIFEKTALAVRVSERLRQMPPGALCAAYMIDLDNFRFVNHVLGRAVGDMLLERTVRLLKERFFSGGVAGRLSDDVFLAVRFDVASEEDARRTAAELCEALRYTVDAPSLLATSASIGLHTAIGSESCFETLARHAGAQLLLAKMRGKNQFAQASSAANPDNCPDARIAEAIRLHILLERSDGWVSLLELGEEPRLLYASPGFFDLLGKKREDVALPCPLHSLGIPSDNLYDHERALREGLLRGEGVVEHAWRLLPETGKERWIYDRALPLDNFGGKHPVMLIVSNDVSAYRQQEQETREAYERLHTLYAETSARLWEVDIATRRFRLFDARARADTAEFGDFPLSLLESGMIHADSSSLFKAFADGLLQGKEEDRAIFAVRLPPADIYRWMSVSYRKVCDDCGRPLKVIGALIPHTSGSVRSSLLQKSLMQEMLRPSLLAYQRVNLTQNMVDDLWERNQPGEPLAQPVHYSDTVHAQEARLYDKDEVDAHNARFSREHLLDAFVSGQRWVVMEYRRIDDRGAIAWVSQAVCLARDPVSCDIYGFIFVRDVERRRDWNVAQALKASHNDVTMLYNLPFGNVLKKMLTEPEEEGMLALIGITGIEGAHMEQLKPVVATSFAVALDADAVVGSFCKNYLICLFPNVVSCQEARQKLENAFIFAHRALSDTPLAENIRFVAALGNRRMLGTDIEGGLCQMRRQCARNGDAVADRVLLMDEIAALDIASYAGGAITVAAQEHAALSGDDGREAFFCLSSMTSAVSPDAALSGLLRHLGDYYQADRAYTLAILGGGDSVEVLHEWTAAGKHSIKRSLTGMPLERIPLLVASLRRQKSLFQTRGAVFSAGTATEKIWSYRVFPLMSDALGMSGFLCFENPQRHQDSTTLIDALMPHILREWEKILQAPLRMDDGGPTPLQDLNAYQAAVPHIDSGSYGSMGVFSVDVPRMSALNSRYSSSYGRRILRDVAEALAGAFDRKLLFRIWDTELIALCPNLVRDVFLARARRVRERLQRLHPNTLRFGLAWADENFTAAQLVNQARNLMLSQMLASDDAPRTFSLGNVSYATFGQAILQGAFTTYLQPKINMRDGALTGAEVLVRGIDERGNIVPPGQFIEQMEKMGYLRDLDLHMLDCTLAHLSRWRARRLPLPRLSVNFSRFTLLSPTIRASVLAILSRHEDISPDLVEIELTETASYCDDAVIEQAINNLRELGFRFALDDFGSQYSNLAIFSNIYFDTIKLDRSLTIALTRNPLNRDMTRSIARVCRQRGMDCIAEGVETQEQISMLLQDGWEQAQGYYFDRPLPVAEFERKYLAV
ncbi:MAG: EAL domain-containing protein [Desulfovibrio sp.]|uniref:EAL domain-containing protein n=1 Tax=Desulfovibrio sp. TaxID=885 RepID=UPI0025BF11EA|nr:EAL domain-containing protein [Desulfovibrio sp.]MCI7569200.1 EAL domain-containing protein [Desulfovibrio sp.]